jgi:hypothetical protein
MTTSPPWWWTQYGRLERLSTPARLHGTISQKTLIFIHEAVRTPYLTKDSSLYCDSKSWHLPPWASVSRERFKPPQSCKESLLHIPLKDHCMAEHLKPIILLCVWGLSCHEMALCYLIRSGWQPWIQYTDTVCFYDLDFSGVQFLRLSASVNAVMNLKVASTCYFFIVRVTVSPFRDVAPCSLVEVKRLARGVYCLHNQRDGGSVHL